MDFLLNESFKDFEQFAEQSRAWHLDFVQLDRGEARFEIVQAGLGGSQIARARFNRNLLQSGQPPLGMRTFVIPADPAVALEWRGHQVTGQDLLVFPEGGELASISQAGFDMVTYSVPVARLAQLSDELQIPSLGELLGDREVVHLDEVAMSGLRQSALSCTDALAAMAAPLAAGGLSGQVADGLASEILLLLASGRSFGSLVPSARARSACLSAALALIDARGADGLTVRQLCQHTGASERTLQYAFKERFQIGPKAFLQAWRLDGVRRKLSGRSQRLRTISDIANDYGFWHMGQFAADYRRQFGELPSETRDRALVGRPLR